MIPLQEQHIPELTLAYVGVPNPCFCEVTELSSHVGAGTIDRGELDIVTSLAEGASSSAMLVYPSLSIGLLPPPYALDSFLDAPGGHKRVIRCTINDWTAYHQYSGIKVREWRWKKAPSSFWTTPPLPHTKPLFLLYDFFTTMLTFTRLSLLATLASALAVFATPSPMPLESRADVDNIVYVTSVEKHW